VQITTSNVAEVKSVEIAAEIASALLRGTMASLLAMLTCGVEVEEQSGATGCLTLATEASLAAPKEARHL
jgi:hypothetical protein